MKKLSDIVKASRDKFKKAGSLGFIAIVAALGLILILLPSGTSGDRDAAEPEPTTAQECEPDELERRMESALSEIEGAGKVTVVLTLKSDGEVHIATDKNYSDKGGDGGREQSEDAVIIGAGSSTQSPVVIKRDYPDYRGALVVAEGAGDPTVRLALIEAVMSLTGLGADRVTVAAMRQQ